MSSIRSKAAARVASGTATEEHLTLLGPEAVADIKTNGSILQVRASASKRISHNEKLRTITYVVSDETPDRVGDIIAVRGWQIDLYKKNPVILWGHDQSIPPIGRGNNVRRRYGTEPRLTADIEFAPAEAHEFADTIYRLAADDFIRATSVGFLPKETKEVSDKERKALGLGKYGQFYSASELMEVSVVGVPANPSALEAGVKSMMSAGALTEGVAPRFLDTYFPEAEIAKGRISDLCKTYIDFGAVGSVTKSEATTEDASSDEDPVEQAIPEAVKPELEERSEDSSQEPQRIEEEQAVVSVDADCGEERSAESETQMETRLAEILANLVQQQAEQTKATRQLVDALSDFVNKLHPSGGGYDRGVEAPDAVQPDAAQDQVKQVEQASESAVRGFADRWRRDHPQTTPNGTTTNV